MTFEEFISRWCDVLPQPDGHKAMTVAQRYLTMSGQISDVTNNRRIVDLMHDRGLYFDRGYTASCALRLRPFARS